jgi:hypothetical protein
MAIQERNRSTLHRGRLRLNTERFNLLRLSHTDSIADVARGTGCHADTIEDAAKGGWISLETFRLILDYYDIQPGTDAARDLISLPPSFEQKETTAANLRRLMANLTEEDRQAFRQLIADEFAKLSSETQDKVLDAMAAGK